MGGVRSTPSGMASAPYGCLVSSDCRHRLTEKVACYRPDAVLSVSLAKDLFYLQHHSLLTLAVLMMDFMMAASSGTRVFKPSGAEPTEFQPPWMKRR